jgi:transcriptional regulator with XRE-family HTH domain
MKKIQDAVRELRNRLGWTQEDLARNLGLTLRTVVRYENDLPPRGPALGRLYAIASEKGHEDLAKLFDAERGKETNKRVAMKADVVFSEIQRWNEIGGLLAGLWGFLPDIEPEEIRSRVENTLAKLERTLAKQQHSILKRRD